MAARHVRDVEAGGSNPPAPTIVNIKVDKNPIGKLDLILKKHKTVIFIDSCFWHGYKRYCRLPVKKLIAITKANGNNQTDMKSLTDEMKNYIQYGTEERRWEFKRPMVWSNNQKKKKCEIAKAVFALSNTTNGGFIIFGISQKRDRSDGVKFKRTGLTIKQFNTFDNSDDIGRFLYEKVNQELKFEIYGNNVLVDNQSKKFVVMQVYESQGAMPVICTYNFKTQDRHCRLEKGALYIRSTSNPIESRMIKSKEEWEELIRRLLSQKEEILHKDLKALCSNVKLDKKQSTVKKPKKLKHFREYDKFLKRDKL